MSTRIFEIDGNPLRFKVCFSKNKMKRDLSCLIKMHGGELVERYSEDLLLICPEDYIFRTDNALSYNYIYKCIETKKLINTEQFRLQNIRKNNEKLPKSSLNKNQKPESDNPSPSTSNMLNPTEKSKMNDSNSSSGSHYNFSFNDEKFEKEMDKLMENNSEDDVDSSTDSEFEILLSKSKTKMKKMNNKSSRLKKSGEHSRKSTTTISKFRKNNKLEKVREQNSNVSSIENLSDSLSTNKTSEKTNQHLSSDNHNSNSDSESLNLLTSRKENIKSPIKKSFTLKRFIKNINNSNSNNNYQRNNEMSPVNDSSSDSETQTRKEYTYKTRYKTKSPVLNKFKMNSSNSPKKHSTNNKFENHRDREKSCPTKITNHTKSPKKYKKIKLLHYGKDETISSEEAAGSCSNTSASAVANRKISPERFIESFSSSSSNEEEENTKTNRQKIKLIPVKGKKIEKIVRRPFTLQEDLKILHFIIKNNYFNRVKGKQIWKLCVENNVIENRHYDTLECRFRKHILKNINNYSIESKYKKKFTDVKDIKPFKENVTAIANEMKEEQQKSKKKFRSRPYSSEEDYKIIKKICEDGNFKCAFSRSFWISLEKRNFLEDRTHHSLETHFRKSILCNLEKYILSSRQKDILNSLKK